MTAQELSRAHTSVRLAWMVFSLVALCSVGTVVFAVLNTGGSDHSGSQEIQDALLTVALFSFPIVGALIASRQPRNPIGWILLAIGLSWELGIGLAGGYAEYGFATNPGSLPRPDLVVALTSSAWVPAVGLMGTFLLLLFPDGRLPSPRWKPLAWLSALVLVLLIASSPLRPGSLQEINGDTSLPNVANPLGVEALRPLIGPMDALVGLLPLCMVGCALSEIGRFRRSRGQERLQLKWLAAGAGLTATLYLALMASGGAEFYGWWAPPAWLNILEDVTIYSFVLIPVSVGVAILKHRLYDIDVIINRALVYGALTAALASAYVVGVVGVGALLRVVSGQETNNLAVAASTLAVAAMFRPARGRIQAFIDRRFYRRKYDAAQTLESFSAKLRDEVHLEAVTAELIAVVSDVVKPSHVSLWFRETHSGGRTNA